MSFCNLPLFLQQAGQATGINEGGEIVISPDMGLTDKNLRHGFSPRS